MRSVIKLYVVKISNLIHVFQLCFQNKVARFTRIGMKYKTKSSAQLNGIWHPTQTRLDLN